MAISNAIFRGSIGGNSINDYSYKLDYSIDDLSKRKLLVNEILNLDNIGSKDEFWQDIWDIAGCKVDLNKTDALWSEGNISQLLEGMGTYLLAKDEIECSKEKKRFSRPKGEVEISGEYSTEDYMDVKSDKNYRLAPPDVINESDYKLRKIFSKDYSYYKTKLYPEYINKLKKKISEDSISRYGHHDGIFDKFSCSEIMSEDTWNNLKRLELEKIRFLNDAKVNLEILNKQNKKIQSGSLHFRPYALDEKVKRFEVLKYDFMNRIIPCHKQLEKSGYNNKDIKEIELKYLYQKKERSAGVSLRHITNNISDVKEYMLMCKLAYTNRVCIDPGKNGANTDILEHVDYKNAKHIENIISMQNNGINYENDMSIISYDINNALMKLKQLDMLDEKDTYIIEGIKYKIPQENIATELEINRKTIRRRLDKVIDKIINIM